MFLLKASRTDVVGSATTNVVDGVSAIQREVSNTTHLYHKQSCNNNATYKSVDCDCEITNVVNVISGYEDAATNTLQYADQPSNNTATPKGVDVGPAITNVVDVGSGVSKESGEIGVSAYDVAVNTNREITTELLVSLATAAARNTNGVPQKVISADSTCCSSSTSLVLISSDIDYSKDTSSIDDYSSIIDGSQVNSGVTQNIETTNGRTRDGFMSDYKTAGV